MYIPTAYGIAQGSADQAQNGGGWSSLIGVVTAICGNVLISFALNTQRYAHMRLSRDRGARVQEKRRNNARRKRRSDEVTEVRNEEHRKQETLSHRALEDRGATETQPLLSKQGSRQLSPSSSPSSPSSSSYSSEELGKDEKDDDDVEEKSYLRSPIWWLGIGMMVVGETGNFLAYGFAPASIVSPLGVVALISNCLIAPLLLKEKFRLRDGLGVLIAVAGAVVVVLSASDSNPKLTPDAIWRLVTTWEFETYLGITVALIIVLTVLSNKYGQKSILIDIGLVGLYGGYTALSTKGIASLLTYSLYKVVTFPISYLLLVVLVVTAVMQIKYVNRALQRFNSTMVIPTQFVMFTISVIVGSAVLYRDFERESPEDAGKFVGGCALTFFGVWCITSGRKSEPNDDYGNEEDDGIGLADEEGTIPEIREHDGPSRNMSLVANSINAPPSLRRAQTAEVGSIPKVHIRAPTLGTTPPGASDWNKYVPEMQPGTASAVHPDPGALNGNGNDNTNPKKPIMHATTSAPVVPQAPDTSSRPKTPLARTPSGPAERPSPHRTPLNRGQTVASIGSQGLLQRTSSIRLGPLTSPLSGSLAAIVADELRRGVDKSPLGTMKRRPSHRPPPVGRRPTDQNEDSRPLMSSSLKRHSIASTDMEFESQEAADLRTAAGSPPNGSSRVRSLSATISDMFGSSGGGGSALKRQRTLERETGRQAGASEEGRE